MRLVVFVAILNISTYLQNIQGLQVFQVFLHDLSILYSRMNVYFPDLDLVYS